MGTIYRVSWMARQEDQIQLQVDVVDDVTSEVIVRDWIYVPLTATQEEAAVAVSSAAQRAFQLDQERRNAEALFMGLSGSIA
ncbi:hypothetical protein A2cp1_1316 [Anaeromyxobacter dehalogenans 2CP-1]|uniref:Uncharacterized protein n=1 Tax=Anaeromyxobacter dehalogenans (strain ATCC BAA-258 / DSM 21875 / 2CP-1) TaxID=455488 RepID=B8JGI9_ANAD2|nr:hypothetical protein [Anaeromyxobacter dehalogenans]ACL64660.1 hypothetical protein A2cp1_1316 [Anaeromyxobacter dehalogenans 2CP-1]